MNSLCCFFFPPSERFSFPTLRRGWCVKVTDCRDKLGLGCRRLSAELPLVYVFRCFSCFDADVSYSGLSREKLLKHTADRLKSRLLLPHSWGSCSSFAHKGIMNDSGVMKQEVAPEFTSLFLKRARMWPASPQGALLTGNTREAQTWLTADHL